MAITLQRLFADCKRNYEIELIAGAKGMKNLVRWVHIVEDTDVPSFLHGNELVFTTGIGIASYKSFNFVEFAKSLIDKEASGWVINIGPYIKDLDKDLIAFCNEYDFPLFTIPWRQRLIDVTYDYSHKIIEAEEKQTTISRAFNDLIYNIGNQKEAIDSLLSVGYKVADNYEIVCVKLYENENVIQTDSINDLISALEAKINIVNKYSLLAENDMLTILLANPIPLDIDNILKDIKETFEEIYTTICLYTGVSDKLIGLDNLAALHKEATVALAAAKILKKEILEYADAGIYQFINTIDNIDMKKRYVYDVLGEIIEYDKENNSNYLEILRLYLEHNFAVGEISELLGVHRNTINYKVKFIKSHFKLELDIKQSAELYLAFAIKDVVENN